MKYLVIIPIVALGLAGTAGAQESNKKNETELRVVEDKMADKEDMGDQSRIICRKVENTGSRLSSRRMCATAGEWAAQKRDNREVLEKRQANRY